MKKYLIYCGVLLMAYGLLTGTAAADDVETGNATAKSTVINNVQGSGSVTTHIETTANGQTNVIDTSGNGVVNVKNDNGNVTVTKTPEVTIIQTQTFNSTPTPKIISERKSQTPSLVSNFFEKLSNFLKRIFRNL